MLEPDRAPAWSRLVFEREIPVTILPPLCLIELFLPSTHILCSALSLTLLACSRDRPVMDGLRWSASARLSLGRNRDCKRRKKQGYIQTQKRNFFTQFGITRQCNLSGISLCSCSLKASSVSPNMTIPFYPRCPAVILLYC